MWNSLKSASIPQSVATAFIVSIGSAAAESTTTAQVGDVGDFLIQRATCQDFADALRGTGDPDQSVEDKLVVLLGIMYMEGYTAGNGTGREGRGAFLLECFAAPERKFGSPAQ